MKMKRRVFFQKQFSDSDPCIEISLQTCFNEFSVFEIFVNFKGIGGVQGQILDFLSFRMFNDFSVFRIDSVCLPTFDRC